VLEASLPLKASGVPYAMLLMSASGRVLRTKVALVSVGANKINQRLIRQLFNAAARLASYRSYRDAYSRESMRQRGLDVSRDPVYPDLVFSRPAPPQDLGDPMTVGVGVMAYFGTNDHRSRADEIHVTYVATMKRFVRWLVDHDRRVRLFVGDGPDNAVASEILDDIRQYRPDLDPDWVMAEPVFSFADLTRAMAPVSSVVATRYHNVICALKLGKPAISLGYAAKNTELMADMGLSEFCQQAHDLDFDQLIAQFTKMERLAPELRRSIAERVAANAERAAEQFTRLSGLLFPEAAPRRVQPGDRGRRQPVG
jgi:polysaccharide pyruvyl transferase WcaK-like protein